MGHESQIEPWLAHDQRSACWFHKSLASSQIEYENHRGRTHKRYAVVRSVPSLWSGMREQSCSIPRGLKVNKNSAEGEVFFVDFPSYRTFQISGFWADYGQSAPYPSLAVRARNGRVADYTGAIRWLGTAYKDHV